jgi:hypothetical protein
VIESEIGAWFAVPPDIALALASILTQHAMAIKRGKA